MGSHDNIRLMGSDFFISQPLFLCGHGAGNKHRNFVNSIFRKQLLHGFKMLSGKHLRRYHKSSLAAVISGLQKGKYGNNGLS